MLVTVQNTTGIGTEVTTNIVGMGNFHQFMAFKTLEAAVNHRGRPGLIHNYHLIYQDEREAQPYRRQ